MAAKRTPLRAALALLLLLAGAAVPGAQAECTSIILGSGATVDGSVLIARSDDGEDFWTANNLVYHPAREGPAQFNSNGNGFQIELPGPGLAYLALPLVEADPASGRNYSGESVGVNSAGVALSATESIYNSKAALAADPYVTDSGVIEDAIPSIILPQATSARQGMQVLGSLVEQHGAGEGFGVLIADAQEAWYIETAGGHGWLAQRVPDDKFFVSANQGRFGEVDLSDTENVMHSPGLEDFAIRAGLFNPTRGRPFSFFEAFMDKNLAQKVYSHPRVRTLQQLFGAVQQQRNKKAKRIEDVPVFMEPDCKLDVSDVMASMRNHFDGTRHDPYFFKNPWEPHRPIAVLRSDNGHIVQLRPAGSVPDALSVIIYLAHGMPALSPFVPIYKGLPPSALPRELTCAGEEPDPDSLFWKARRLQGLVFQDWPAIAPWATEAILSFEKGVQKQQAQMEGEYTAAVNAKDAQRAQRILADFTAEVVRDACALLDQLTAQAAEALALPEVPSDAQFVQLLQQALDTYPFLPPYDDARLAARRRARRHRHRAAQQLTPAGAAAVESVASS